MADTMIFESTLSGSAVPGDWPSIGIVRSALVGIAEVFRSEGGDTITGVRSSYPWIFWAREHGIVYCERCGHGARNPAPIKLDDAGQALNSPAVYAQHLLFSTLYPFARDHKNCVIAEVEPPQELSA